MEHQQVLQGVGAFDKEEYRVEEHALIDVSTSAEGVLHTAAPPRVEGVDPDLDDDKLLECALDLKAGFAAPVGWAPRETRRARIQTRPEVGPLSKHASSHGLRANMVLRCTRHNSGWTPTAMES